MHLRIERLWDGAPAPAKEHVELELVVQRGGLVVTVDAPLHGDPAPPAAPGPTPELWNHEVVELFLFADGERYLETELGPHGHYLILDFVGRRQIRAQVVDIDYRTHFDADAGRWRGRLRLPLERLPPGLTAINAHAIHGPATVRCYLSAYPAAGERPDFHRADAAVSIDPLLRRALSGAPH